MVSLALAGGVEASLIQERIAEIAPLRSKRVTADAPGIDPKMYLKAASGDVQTGVQNVEGHSAKKAYGVAVVSVPIDRMWSAVNDESSKVEATALSYLEVLEGENCKDGRVVLQYLPLSLVADRWWVVRQQMNEPLGKASAGRVQEVRWSSLDAAAISKRTTPSATAWMKKGIPVEYTHGSWFLVDLDGKHTLIEYYAWTDPGGRIPAGLASTFASGTISDTMSTMADLARRGPRCKL